MRTRSSSKPRFVNVGDREHELADTLFDQRSRLAVEDRRKFEVGWQQSGFAVHHEELPHPKQSVTRKDNPFYLAS